MRKNWIRNVGLAVLTVVLVTSTTGCPPGAVVVINDEVLEAAIRVEVSKPLGFLTVGDMLLVRNLDIKDLGIADLTGLEFCANMRFLDASGNPISDLSPLANSLNLRSLNLDDTDVFETNDLEGLLNLKSLSLCGTQVTDIQPLVANSTNGGLGTDDFVNLPCNTLGDEALATDIPTLAAAGVNVICCGGGDPVLTVGMTANLDFGDMAVGASDTRTITIDNTGNGVLVWGITRDDPGATWVTSIDPDTGITTTLTELVDVTINTTGLSAGEHTTTIDVVSNGGDVLDITIRVNVL